MGAGVHRNRRRLERGHVSSFAGLPVGTRTNRVRASVSACTLDVRAGRAVICVRVLVLTMRPLPG